jgi:hypothetical protein
MKPMGFNSTPFLAYRSIRTEDIDLIEDAFGLYSEFDDVIAVLGILKIEPGKRLTNSLIKKVRKKV